MITFRHRGNFKNAEKFLEKNSSINIDSILHRYGREGVDALAAATPVDTGETSKSWTYEVKKTRNGSSLTWSNTNAPGGVPVVILIQYGHATKGGTYVQGIDFINPVMKPIFDQIAKDIWKAVT